MSVPVLSGIAAFARFVWNKLRSRPTVQANGGAVAAGGDQTINAPAATSGGVVATDQAIVVTGQGGSPTIIVQSGGTVNLVPYVDGLPQAKDPALRAAFEEGRRLQDEGYEAQNAHKHQEAIDRFTRALALAENDSQRAALHGLRGNSYESISQYNDAQTDYEETLRLADNIPDTREAAQARASALGNLGLVYHERGDLEKAEEHHKQALKIDREIGNRLGEAQDLGNLGLIYTTRGDLDEAEQHLQQVLDVFRKLGNRLGEANALGNLGNVYSQRGELEKAEECHKQALEIDREIGNRQCEAQDLGNLGTVFGQRGGPGDTDKAEEHFKQALEIRREIGNHLGEAQDLGNLGNVYRQRGDLEKAEAHYRQALELDRENGSRLGEAQDLANLGLLYARRGDARTAREHLQQAQTTYQEIGAGGEGPEIVRQALEELERRQQQERGE